MEQTRAEELAAFFARRPHPDARLCGECGSEEPCTRQSARTFRQRGGRPKNWKCCAACVARQRTRHLERADDERETARAFDTAVRQRRASDEHSMINVRSGTSWLRPLNLATTEMEAQDVDMGAALTKDDTTVAATASERQGSSEFVGVSWSKKGRKKWMAQITRDGKKQHVGSFDSEREAALAFDTAARGLRGNDAHGGRSAGKLWLRLNFPSRREAERAKALGMPGAPGHVVLRSCDL